MSGRSAFRATVAPSAALVSGLATLTPVCPWSDLRFTASLDEWTAGARAAFDGSGQRLSPRRLRLTVGNVTCEQLHFHVLVRRGQGPLCIRA